MYIYIVSLLVFLVSWLLLTPMQSLILLTSILIIYIVYVFIIKSSKMNIIPLLFLLTVIMRYLLRMTGNFDYDYTFRITYDILVFIYIAFIVTNFILAISKDDYKAQLPVKVFSTIVFINILTFMIQFNVYDINMYHDQTDITPRSSETMYVDMCEEGYGYNPGNLVGIQKGCIKLDTMFVSETTSAIPFLAVIYFSLGTFSLLYSSITLDPTSIQVKNEKSASKMTDFLKKDHSHIKE